MSSRRGNGGGSDRGYYSSTGGGGSSYRSSYGSGGSGYGSQDPPRSSSHSGSSDPTITSGNRNANQHNAHGSSFQAPPVYNAVLDHPPPRWPTAAPVNGVFPPVPPPPVPGLRFDNTNLPPAPGSRDAPHRYSQRDEGHYLPIASVTVAERRRTGSRNAPRSHSQEDEAMERDDPSSIHSYQPLHIQEEDVRLNNQRYQRHLAAREDSRVKWNAKRKAQRDEAARERAQKKHRQDPRDRDRRGGQGGATGIA